VHWRRTGAARHQNRSPRIGLTDEQVGLERDAWMLLNVLYPQHLPRWVERQERLLDDPEVARLYVDLHAARGWPVDDPRLEPLARRAATLAARHRDAIGAAADMTADVRALRMVDDYGTGVSATWARLNALATRLAEKAD
jgi:hypothetical protein